MSQQKLLTPEQAEALLVEGEMIHTFRQLGHILLGGDYPRKWILDSLEKAVDGRIELTGPTARRMGHGLALWDEEGPLFVETDREKLEVFRQQYNTEEE